MNSAKDCVTFSGIQIQHLGIYLIAAELEGIDSSNLGIHCSSAILYLVNNPYYIKTKRGFC